MRKLAASLAATIALSGGAAVINAQPAAAANNVVTKTEFRKADRGLKKEKVHRIFDTDGRLSYQGYGYMAREYKTPNRYGFVSVSFERRNGVWVLAGKSAYWG